MAPDGPSEDAAVGTEGDFDTDDAVLDTVEVGGRICWNAAMVGGTDLGGTVDIGKLTTGGCGAEADALATGGFGFGTGLVDGDALAAAALAVCAFIFSLRCCTIYACKICRVC